MIKIIMGAKLHKINRIAKNSTDFPKKSLNCLLIYKISVYSQTYVEMGH